MPLILAVDLGSSQLKLLVMDEKTEVVAVVTAGYPTYTPKPGWLIQDPEDWEAALKKGFEELSGLVDLRKIEAVSFSGHMSGTVLVDEAGTVLYPCIMLPDSRSSQECGILERCVGERIREMTGNPVIDAFSLPKLLWIKRHEPDLYQKTAFWLSPKDYIRFLFTGILETEYTDAYNSLCIDRKKSAPDGGTPDWWSEATIRLAGLDREKFPPVHGPMERAGGVTSRAAALYGLKTGTPVVYGGADMACGAVGNGLFETGDTTLTLGTCATFLCMAEETEEAFGKVTFHMHVLPEKVYALGSHFNGGLAVNWFSKAFSQDGRIDYGLIAELSKEASAVAPGSGGVMTLPFLAGSGSPYFDTRDKQSVIGIDASTARGALFRSQLEGVSYNLRQTLELFERMQMGKGKPIVLGGGGVRVGVWPRMIADVFGRTVLLAENPDASAVGAALMGGAGTGIFGNLCEASKRALSISECVKPVEENAAVYDQCYQRYLKVYEVLQQLKI